MATHRAATKAYVKYIIISLGLIISGCANFVKTERINRDSITEGISYYLPKRTHQLTITAIIPEFEKRAKARLAAQSALDVKLEEQNKREMEWNELEYQALSTPVTNKNTINASAKEEITKAAQTAEGIYKTARRNADIAQNDVLEREKELKEAQEKKRDKCLYQITMTIAPQLLEPDNAAPLTLTLNHSWLRDDEVTIQTTSSGLLTNSKVTTTDRTGDVIVEIAKIVGMFFGVPPGPDVTRKAEAVRAPTPPKEDKLCFPTELSFKKLIDFADITGVNPIKLSDSLVLRAKEDYKQYDMPTDLLLTVEKPNNSNQQLSTIVENICEATNVLTKNNSIKPPSSCSTPAGILYRRDAPYIVNLFSDEKKSYTIGSIQIFMPNLSPVSVLPVESLALVTTKNDATFVDGMLVTHTANLPSQALGLVSLPARVLKGYFEAIGSILKLKIDTTKGQTDMINELIGQIEAKKKLEEAIAPSKP